MKKAELHYVQRGMTAVANPALEAFVRQLPDELIVAQVRIRRRNAAFELRHVKDLDQPDDALRPVPPADLRSMAQFTHSGAFRPLKSAPNLPGGWRAVCAGTAELQSALDALYPGFIADWHAVQSGTPPVTHYREFTNRQSGMYRITAKLSDARAAQTILACCHKSFCLKRRHWTVEGLAPDKDGEKSLIPCLEPCALLLEFARKSMRIEQQDKIHLEITPDDAATVCAALEAALARPDPEIKEADFSAPNNPRRLHLVLEKLKPLLAEANQPAEE